MPIIWQAYPQAEFWLVGSNPPKSLQNLANDKRVKVTGYIERVQDILKTMSAVLCPWTGEYGFRSRLVEVMALGVPVVASTQAVYGIDMQSNKGIFLEDSASGMGKASLKLLSNTEFARRQSRLARQQTEEKFSFETSYEHLANELLSFVLSIRKFNPKDL
jgi:glycosyltransferase involved in cell wall biosynthesis